MSDVNFDDRFNNNLPDYVSLTPVDYDPFGRAAQRTRAHYEKANQRMSGLPDVLNVIGGRVASGLTAPLDALTGKLQVNDPETGMPTQEAMGRAGDVAGLTGIGSPFAVKGALGSAGGKLMQMENKAPPFYSALEHAVTNVKQEKMPADQWLGTISNAKGVKPEELDWTGFKDFLAEKGKAPVTKAEVQEHLNNNKVELKEVNKGELKFDKTHPYAIPEVIKAAKQAGDTPGDLELTLSNDDDAYRALTKKFPELHNDENWGETVSKAVFGGDSMPSGTNKYSQYQLPGGENYREMLMTMPKQSEAQVYRDALANKYQHLGGNFVDHATKTEQDKLYSLMNKPREDYKSSHWDEPNILAHVRINDRNIEGKKSLHLEEIQSDWHQQGREKGYKNPETQKRVDTAYQKLEDAKKELNKGFPTTEEIDAKLNPLREEYAAANKANDPFAVPDAPFKKSWHELALKRMIREAAEKGYDRLSWTPGEAQAARYDLSKQVEQISFNPENGMLKAYKKGGNGEKVIDEKIKPNELASYVGKEAADKLVNNPTRTFNQTDGKYHILEGEGLRVGGEGMKGFYDQIIPKAIEKIGKEHGVKVKTTQEENPKVFYERENNNGPSWQQLNQRERQYWAKEAEKHQPIHYIDIPQSLKDTAMSKGFPLFNSGLPFNLTPIDHDPFEKKK